MDSFRQLIFLVLTPVSLRLTTYDFRHKASCFVRKRHARLWHLQSPIVGEIRPACPRAFRATCLPSTSCSTSHRRSLMRFLAVNPTCFHPKPRTSWHSGWSFTALEWAKCTRSEVALEERCVASSRFPIPSVSVRSYPRMYPRMYFNAV